MPGLLPSMGHIRQANTSAVQRMALTVCLKDWHAKPKARPRVTSRGTYMPGGYQDWLNETRFLMQRELAGMPPASGKLAVRILVQAPSKPRGDLDNLAGGILDAGNHVIWPDDRFIYDLAITYRKGHACITIHVTQYEEAQDGT